MPRRQHLITGVAAGLILSGCSGAVAVDVPDLAADVRDVCSDVIDALPDSIGDQERVDVVDAAATQAAAYGDPALVVVCGVDRPDELMTNCFTVEGVDWYVPDATQDPTVDVVATTVGREPGVQLRVPAEYRPLDAEFVDVAEAIRDTTRVVEPCPTS